MARPANAEKMIDSLAATTEAKARLTAIIMTMSGTKPVPEACAELGIGEARFHEMRKEFLADALGLLEKKAAGRKPAAPPEDATERTEELKDEVLELRAMLEASRIRTEIALTMPHLLKERAKAGEGIGSPKNGKTKKKKRHR